MVAAQALDQYQHLLSLLKRGNFNEAARACDALISRHPGFSPAWASASQIAMMLRDPPRAIKCAERAVALDPDNPRYLTVKAHALLADARQQAAVTVAAAAGARCGFDSAAWQDLGTFYVSAERYHEACDAFQRAVMIAPGSADARFNLAAVLRILGRIDEAELEYDRVIALRPGEHEAYINRTELRRQTAERNHVDELERLLAAGVPHPRGEVFIRYALAKELEDMQAYSRSFEHLRLGSALRRKHIEYDVERDVATVQWIQSAFPAQRFREPRGGDPSSEPIFIVGMPRTGTTLVERILGRHPDVFAAGELPHFAAAITSAATALRNVPSLRRQELVEASAGIDFVALGRNYLARTRPATGHTLHFIDKMPLNYLYCGLIRLALPNARIVHMTRHPMATCYAVYKTLFKDAYPFSYELRELAAYYAAYRRLMLHWNGALPGVILDVRYESVVNNLETESRRLLNFCGLQWTPACIDFHLNPHPTATASASQVRRPLYDSSVYLWQRYAEELAPLRDLLIEAGIPAGELAP